jgi:hypothetical protein
LISLMAFLIGVIVVSVFCMPSFSDLISSIIPVGFQIDVIPILLILFIFAIIAYMAFFISIFSPNQISWITDYVTDPLDPKNTVYITRASWRVHWT